MFMTHLFINKIDTPLYGCLILTINCVLPNPVTIFCREDYYLTQTIEALTCKFLSS